MKHFFSVFVFEVLLVVGGCKEIGPDVNLHDNANAISDTAYIETPIAPEPKNVIIEEFTGVRCTNCPQGHEILANIQSANSGRAFAVSFHPINSLGSPYAFSPEDLQTDKSQILFDYLGHSNFEPSATIDRQMFSGETALLLDKTKWTSYATQQIAQTTPVNLELTKVYDSVSRTLTIAAEIHYTQAVSEPNKITIVLLENGIVAPQLDNGEVDTFYVHNYVARDFVTATQGDAITYTTEAGRVVRKVYSKTLDAAWIPENMNIVAYVHEFQNSKIVYQGKSVSVK